MAMAVAVLRRLLQDKLPRESFLVLWAVVALRLMVPVNVSAGCNIYAWLEAGIARGVKEACQLLEGVSENGVERQKALGSLQAEERGEPASGKAESASMEESAQDMESAAGFLATAWKAVYLAGVFLCAGYYLAAYARCRREFRCSLPVEDPFVLHWADSLSMKRRVSVRQSEAIAAPVTYGVFCPVILLPKRKVWEDEGQLEFALAHEAEHIRHFDIGKKLAFVAAACIHWCNPLVWMMLALANRDLELACDGRVVRRYGDGVRSAYAYALICMEEKKSNWAIVGNGFSDCGMEERIEAIMNRKKWTIGTFAAAAVMVAGVTAVFATAPAAEEKDVRAQAGMAAEIKDDGGDAMRRLMHSISVSEEFPEYEKLGLSYDEEGGRLMYKGEAVGYFKDEIEPGVCRRFSMGDGAAGIVVARDSSNKIIGFHAGGAEEIKNLYSTSEAVATQVETGDGEQSTVTVTVIEGEGGMGRRDPKGNITAPEELSREEMQETADGKGLCVPQE